MKKYVAIYGAPLAEMDKMMEMMKDSTPEEQKARMDSWNAWMEKHKDAIVEQGAPLGKNLRITAIGTSKVRNEINGFTVVQGETAEAAAEIFKDNPMFSMPGAYIDLLEWVEM